MCLQSGDNIFDSVMIPSSVVYFQKAVIDVKGGLL